LNAIPNRAALLASLNAPTPDSISFAGMIRDRATDLQSVAYDVFSAEARGHVPGAGTCRELERIGGQLLQAAQAWRAGRV
jgi:hypothetical protein